MKCKESSSLKTANFDENLNFREIFKFFLAASVQNHEDTMGQIGQLTRAPTKIGAHHKDEKFPVHFMNISFFVLILNGI